MSLYQTSRDPPLNFHKFFHYVCLPVNLLLCIARFYNTFLSEDAGPLYIFVFFDFLYYLAWFVLAVATFVGFFGFKRFSWYTVLALLTLTPAYTLLTVFLFAVLAPDSVAYALGQFFGFAVYSSLVIVYYVKRKRLFVREQNPMAVGAAVSSWEFPPPVEMPNPVPQGSSYQDLDKMFIGEAMPARGQAQNPEKAAYCSQCGSRLRPGGQFCSQCGARAE